MNLECSSRGDRRFSAFYARIKTLDNKSIETIYQNAKRTEDNKVPGKGKKVHHMVWNNKCYPASKLSALYEYLWRLYFKENPDLLKYACQFDTFSDMFRGHCINCQADIIEKLVKEVKNNV